MSGAEFNPAQTRHSPEIPQGRMRWEMETGAGVGPLDDRRWKGFIPVAASHHLSFVPLKKSQGYFAPARRMVLV